NNFRIHSRVFGGIGVFGNGTPLRVPKICTAAEALTSTASHAGARRGWNPSRFPDGNLVPTAGCNRQIALAQPATSSPAPACDQGGCLAALNSGCACAAPCHP